MSTTQTPISLNIPPFLSHLRVPLSTFLARNPRYQALAVGACIFFPPVSQEPLPASSQPPRLLLVQRAATEFAFPNLWEFPGGSSEASDPTVLHSVAREVFEETGLLVRRLNNLVGEGVEFVTGTGDNKNTWLKLTIEVEVVEIPNHSHRDGPTNGASGETAVDEVRITLDPEEHQQYAWVTEEDVRRTPEEGGYEIMTEEQREVMLQAFGMRKGGGKGRFLPLTAG